MRLPESVQAWPEYWKELFAERSAIKEYEGNMTRDMAELSAEIDIRHQAEQV